MNLFGRKREETRAAPARARNGSAAAAGCCIKVLGSGCKSCHALYENVQEAVKATGLNAETEYVTDMENIASYGVMSTPALVINEKVVSMGRVLKAADVEKLLHSMVQA